MPKRIFAAMSGGVDSAAAALLLLQAGYEVTGVTILSLSETPGLGMNAQNADFTDMYKQPVPENGFTVLKSGTADNGNIVALTGATITSQAVTDAVNAAVSQYHEIKGGA